MSTNPYQAPQTVGEPLPNRGGFLRRLVGMVCMLLCPLATGYAALIVVFVVLSGLGVVSNPVPIFAVLTFCGVMVLLGLGLGVFGYGIWTRRSGLTRRGAAMIGVALVSYIAVAIGLS